MDQNYTNYAPGLSNPQQVYLRDSQSVGLPINSRLTNESFSPNARFLNNYSGVQQQLLSPFQIRNSVVSNENVLYRGTAQGQPQFAGVGGVSYSNNQDVLTQRSTQRVLKSRMVPVTQYVPVYEVEQVPITAPLENQIIHQRVILHEPEAFKSRTYYEEKTEANPTLVEETKIIYQQQASKVNTKVVKVSQDPLVETVQGGWQSQYVAASRTSISPPAPLPRQEKSCCSPWLLLLLGLLALAGILTAILLGKNSSSTQISSSQKTQLSGTKVSQSNVPKNITSVPPLTNVDGVFGTTAVTRPTFVEPITQTVRPLQYVAPTQISLAAKPQTVSTQTSQIKPQTTNLISVQPIVVSNPTVTQVYESKVGNTVIPNQPITYVTPTQVRYETSTVQPSTIAPTVINPTAAYVSPTKVESIAPTVINPTVTYVTPTKVASVTPNVIPSVVQPTTYVNPTVITRPSTVNPTVTTTSSVITSTPTVIPSVRTQTSVVNPTLIKPSTVNPTVSTAQPTASSVSTVQYNANTLSSVDQQKLIKAQTATTNPQPVIMEPKEPFYSKVASAPAPTSYTSNQITPDYVPAVQVS